MRKIYIFNRKGFRKILFYFLYIFMIFLISGCGGGGDDSFYSESSETGSASFNIAWHDTPVVGAAENAIVTPTIDCEAAGVSIIIFEVYDGSNTYLTSQDFVCSAGQGTITDVPVGTDRELVILGEDAEGNILLHGTITGITVNAGQINDAGTIDVYPFVVSTLLSPGDGSEVIIDDFSLEWTPVNTAYNYRIQVSEDSDPGFNNPIIDETTINPPYQPSGLLASTKYNWKVFARDIHANQSAESDVWSFTVIPSGPCTYSISPENRSFGSGGGAGSITVTASASTCEWTATESVGWITITSDSSGSGNGTVTYTVDPNTSSTTRSATITVAGKSHTVTQTGVSCNYTISPTSLSFTSSGGTGTITVTSSAGDCSWTASESVGWITITSDSSGSGNSKVTYTVSTNTSSSERTATITVAGKSHTVTQAGVSCTYSISPTSKSFTSDGGTGTISVTTSASDCSWTATPSESWIKITSGKSGIGNWTVTYSVSKNPHSISRSAWIEVAGINHYVAQDPRD
jgi:hypothetical protein